MVKTIALADVSLIMRTPTEKTLPRWRRRWINLKLGPPAIYFAASALAKAGSIVLIPLYTRRLSLAEYGDYAILQTAIALLPMLLSFGLVSAIPRFYFADGPREAALLRTGSVARWLIVLVLGTTTLLLGVVRLMPWQPIAHSGRWELTCTVLASAGSALAGIPSVYLRAANRPFAAAAFQVSQFVTLTVSGLVLVLVLGRGFRGSIESVAIANGIEGLVGVIFTLVALKGPLNWSILREALAFAFPFVPHFLGNWLQSVGDRWALELTGNRVDLGPYAVASQLVAPTTMSVNAWNDAESASMGEIYRSSGLGGIDGTILRTHLGYLFAAFLPGIGIVAMTPLLSWILGRDFGGALTFLPLLAVISIVESVYFPNSNVLYYARRTRVIPLVTVASGLLNIALSFALIPRLGVAGAILARSMSSTIRSVWMWYLARSVLLKARLRIAGAD